MGTMKTNTGMLSRLELCYLDIAHYLFDRGNWRLETFLPHIVNSPINVVTLS